MSKSIALIIPVLNGGPLFRRCLEAIASQDVPIQRKLVMDSTSTDGSDDLAREFGYEVVTLPKSEFDHGGTRNRALARVDEEIVVFVTQDAVLTDAEALGRLLAAFDEPGVAAVYGRQLPHDDASAIAAHARAHNYGDESYVTRLGADRPRGFRKCFMSNSFAAYDREALMSVGGFPEKLILGEDSLATAKLLKAGHAAAYQADATAQHSHNYTTGQEFRRYFDTGVFHETQSWMLDEFGKVEGEGMRFALGQLGHLRRQGRLGAMVKSALDSGAKFLGYKLGRAHRRLGRGLSRRLAMHKAYFS